MEANNTTISNLPPLRDVIAAHNLRAEKKLGQNFLLDLNITDRIARSAGDLKETTAFEIGPGPGGLTRSLLQTGAERVIAIEYDPRAVRALEDLVQAAEGRLEIIQADALNTDLLSLSPEAGKRAIVANLPYNIAVPLLLGWLEQMRETPGAWDRLILMVQREVADRLTAPPSTKARGRLSIMTQWLCTPKRLFDLPPSAFTPAPKVTSSVVSFTPHPISKDAPSFQAMESVTAAAFGQRRKMLRSSLKAFPGLLEKAGIEDTLRAEQLSTDDFVRLAQHSDL